MSDITSEPVIDEHLNLQQELIDIILETDSSDAILKIYSPIEIKIEGRPLSLQNKNTDEIEKFKEKILKELDQYDYVITNRVKLEIQLYIQENKLYEDHLLPDIDNCLKKLIDNLQVSQRGILIEDTQVDEVIIRRTRILSKLSTHGQEEYFIIRILPMCDDTLFAIKKDEIIFIPVSTPQPSVSDSQRYYPVPNNDQSLIKQIKNLFAHLNNDQQELNNISYLDSNHIQKSVGTYQYQRSIGMNYGTFFLGRIKNKGFKILTDA